MATAPSSTAKDPAAQRHAIDEPVVELRDPVLAAFLAWLIPGAGHLYQRRTAKGLLFMVCILGTFFYGLFLGEGHVVYASWRPADKMQRLPADIRLPYLCQVGAGLPALPALLQAYRVKKGREPLFGGFMAPPRREPVEDFVEQPAQSAAKARAAMDQAASDPADGGADAAGDAQPRNRPREGLRSKMYNDELSMWNYKLHRYFDIGTTFTMIAGLLNILAIYDAWGGPMFPARREEPAVDPKAVPATK